MIAGNYLPITIQSEFKAKNDTLDITSRKSKDGKTITLQAVNRKATPVNTTLLLNSYKGSAKVSITILKSDSLNSTNTAEEPGKIAPIKRFLIMKGNNCNYTFAPYSFTIMKFEK